MKQTKNIINILMLLFTLSAQAEIREAATMKEALNNLAVGDFVVFDIDNTVLEPAQTLGSDQWFEYRVQVHKAQGEDEKLAVERAIDDWLPVQKATEVKLVETETSQMIKELQDKGIEVIALTARPEDLESATIRQLQTVGVKFKNILFSFGKNKGVVLREFINQNGFQLTRLIFIDDKEKNVKNMDAEFVNDNIVNINFRYGAADQKVQNFSKDIAEIQWFYFQEYSALVSDEQAEQILNDEN